MRPPPVIVAGPVPNSYLQMPFVEGKQEVETFATEAAAQSLAYRVRLWSPHWRSQNPYAQIPKTLVDLLSEDTVPIVDDEAIGMITRHRFPELLQRPFRRGMASDIVVENPPRTDLHDDEDVEGTECGGDHHEEVAGHHDLGMVADKGQPALFGGRRVPWTVSMQVLADGAWGDPNSELQLQLIGDAFLTPGRIL